MVHGRVTESILYTGIEMVQPLFILILLLQLILMQHGYKNSNYDELLMCMYPERKKINETRIHDKVRHKMIT